MILWCHIALFQANTISLLSFLNMSGNYPTLTQTLRFLFCSALRWWQEYGEFDREQLFWVSDWPIIALIYETHWWGELMGSTDWKLIYFWSWYLRLQQANNSNNSREYIRASIYATDEEFSGEFYLRVYLYRWSWSNSPELLAFKNPLLTGRLIFPEKNCLILNTCTLTVCLFGCY